MENDRAGSPCARYRELLGPYLDRELEPPERAGVEDHLLACPECRRIHGEHRAVWTLLGDASLPLPRLDDSSFLSAVKRRARGILQIRKRESGRRTRWLLAAAAFAVFASGLGLFLPRRIEDQAIIENLSVLQDLQDLQHAHPGAPAEVADVGREILSLLSEEEGGATSGEELLEVLEAALSEGERGG
jgi:anti-sigma factor RsiW